ncbi:MAG: ribonuclease HI family protein [Patescibacteria group bacterium]|nr:ribonuclease HI family protein [Patescibacteria group bacterium]
MINVYSDGGARGNPGPAAIGIYVADDNGKKIYSHGEKIGVSTNNQAEYKALIKGLLWVLENKDKTEGKVNFFLDSELVYFQIIGKYKIKNSDLRNLLFKIRELETQVGGEIKYFHIPREKNRQADKMVNMALDNLPISS